MEEVLEKYQHLRIQLKEIKSATGDFDEEKCIGVGGFGKVYQGEMSHFQGRSMVAIKRLDHTSIQGIPEFLKEITTLFDYRHENLISLLGFCFEGLEMILVYELAYYGSLDRYLNSFHLTWKQRLKICFDAAKGLAYLHDPRQTHRRLIHCDIKSANILLDDQWNAKVSDFGLSMMGSANEQHSLIVTPAAGTKGYIDPLYWTTHTLTRKSDVYSFGVVLFEVLCGTFCHTISDGHNKVLVPMWLKSYEEKKLNDIIFKNPTIEPLKQRALEIFSDITYQCLKESREERPDMVEVVTELQRALNIHELLQNQEFERNWNRQLFCYEEMINTAESPLHYTSEIELMELLYKGVLLNNRKTWFMLNMKGEHCEMISIIECLDSTPSRVDQFWRKYINVSRFPVGTYYSRNGIFNTRVRTQFLTPGVTYTVNLVFKFHLYPEMRDCRPIYIAYKLQGHTGSSISHLAYERHDGWWMAELCQFTSDQRIFHLRISFEGLLHLPNGIEAQGIEFQPLEKVEHKDEISNSDANWEEKMPTNYRDIMNLSTENLQWTTEKDAYSIMCEGFLINDDMGRNILFSLGKNGKTCLMLSAAHIWPWYKENLFHFSTSRFEEAMKYDIYKNSIETKVESQLVLSKTTYAAYLVYKLPEDESGFEAPVEVNDVQSKTSDKTWFFYLVSPQTPVIRTTGEHITTNPLFTPKITGLPQQRNNDWMEVQIWEFQTAITIDINLIWTPCDKNKLTGLIIEGIEFRPI